MIRCYQHYYTSCPKGFGHTPGFQTKAYSSEISPHQLEVIEKFCHYYLPIGWDPTKTKGLPLSYNFYPLDKTHYALSRSEYIGLNFENRPGNFFAHTLIISKDDYAKIKANPFNIFYSDVFVNKDTIPDPRKLPSLEINPIIRDQNQVWDEFIHLFEENFLHQYTEYHSRDTYTKDRLLIDIICTLLFHKEYNRQVVLMADEQQTLLSLIEAAILLLPLSWRPLFSFSTYQLSPEDAPNLDWLIVPKDREVSPFSFNMESFRHTYFIFDIYKGEFSEITFSSSGWEYIVRCLLRKNYSIIDKFYSLANSIDLKTKKDFEDLALLWLLPEMGKREISNKVIKSYFSIENNNYKILTKYPYLTAYYSDLFRRYRALLVLYIREKEVDLILSILRLLIKLKETISSKEEVLTLADICSDTVFLLLDRQDSARLIDLFQLIHDFDCSLQDSIYFNLLSSNSIEGSLDIFNSLIGCSYKKFYQFLFQDLLAYLGREKDTEELFSQLIKFFDWIERDHQQWWRDFKLDFERGLINIPTFNEIKQSFFKDRLKKIFNSYSPDIGIDEKIDQTFDYIAILTNDIRELGKDIKDDVKKFARKVISRNILDPIRFFSPFFTNSFPALVIANYSEDKQIPVDLQSSSQKIFQNWILSLSEENRIEILRFIYDHQQYNLFLLTLRDLIFQKGNMEQRLKRFLEMGAIDPLVFKTIILPYLLKIPCEDFLEDSNSFSLVEIILKWILDYPIAQNWRDSIMATIGEFLLQTQSLPQILTPIKQEYIYKWLKEGQSRDHYFIAKAEVILWLYNQLNIHNQSKVPQLQTKLLQSLDFSLFLHNAQILYLQDIKEIIDLLFNILFANILKSDLTAFFNYLINPSIQLPFGGKFFIEAIFDFCLMNQDQSGDDLLYFIWLFLLQQPDLDIFEKSFDIFCKKMNPKDLKSFYKKLKSLTSRSEKSYPLEKIWKNRIQDCLYNAYKR